MSKELFFWLVYIVSLVMYCFLDWPAPGAARPFGGRIIVFVLVGILAWCTIGAPVR
jgi:hypothetical protein